MKRIIGFDYGTKKLGVAVSDPLRITAQPVDTVTVKKADELPERLSEIFSEYDAEKVVVGLPLNMNGTEGETAAEARAFADRIKEEFNLEVVMWDERLSSRTVERAMLEDNMRRRKRRNRKDIMAAVVILQNYLDFISG